MPILTPTQLLHTTSCVLNPFFAKRAKFTAFYFEREITTLPVSLCPILDDLPQLATTTSSLSQTMNEARLGVWASPGPVQVAGHFSDTLAESSPEIRQHPLSAPPVLSTLTLAALPCRTKSDKKNMLNNNTRPATT